MRPQTLRICLISEEYPPETGWGGIGTYTYNLAGGLAQLGHRVHVISRGWGEPSSARVQGVELHRVCVPEPSWRWGTWFINMQLPECRYVALWNLAVRRTIAEIIDREGLDLIEAPEYHAQGLASSLFQGGVPVIVRLHTPSYLCREVNGVSFGGSRWDTLFTEQAERWLARRAALVTSPSRALATDVARRWRMDPDAIRVIPNPIDDQLFCPPPSPSERPNIIFVGRLERRKGVQTLIEAMPIVHAAFPQARAILVGSDHASAPDGGSMKAHLQRCAKASGMPEGVVQFMGAVDRSALPAIYGSAQVCVIPSLYENFPYTCLEAMACGCAVVASRVGGIPEIATDGIDGVLIEAGDAPALARAILGLLKDNSHRQRLGSRARQTVCSRFSRDATTAQTLRVYRTFLGSRPVDASPRAVGSPQQGIQRAGSAP